MSKRSCPILYMNMKVDKTLGHTVFDGFSDVNEQVYSCPSIHSESLYHKEKTSYDIIRGGHKGEGRDRKESGAL